MASFGENLRREREMRAVTLEEISAATKIGLRFLNALEAEEFSALPSGIFTRSFIRAYAKYLGLDEEPLLAEYQLAAQPADLDLNQMTATRPSGERRKLRPTLLALLVAVAMLGASYLIYHSRRAGEMGGKVTNPGQVSAAPTSTAPPSASEASPPPSPLPAAATTAETKPEAALSVNTGAAALSGPSQQVQTAPLARNPSAGGELTLQVAATEQAWVAVSADGKTTLQRILNPREFKTLKAKESFDVITGNAQGIILTLNGETLNPMGGHNVYKKVHLTRDDLKNPAP